MMFTSMPAIARHKDPKPYLIKETGERVDQSAFGTPGVTIYFDPRPEYMPASRLPVNRVLELIRENWTSDSWGSSMSWLTAVAGQMEKNFGGAPKHWRTDLPTKRFGPEMLDELAGSIPPAAFVEMLRHAGDVLEHLSQISEMTGKAYPLQRPVDTDY